MEKEKVEQLVKKLMERLCIDNSELEFIMQDYTARNLTIFKRLPMKPIVDLQIIADINESEKEEEDNFPESAKMVYFPWDDVIGSMIKYHEKVHFSDEVCPDCGNRLLNIEFCSPTWTWVALCGRSGPMKLCLHCPKQIHFALLIMN